MGEDKSEILSKVKMLLSSSDLESEEINTVTNTLVTVLDDYEVSKRCTELITFDDTNEKILTFFERLLEMNSKSPATIKQYINATKKCINTIGKKYNEINKFDIISYFAKIRPNVSDRTYNNYIRYINSFFKWANEEGFIATNPMKAVTIVKEPKVIKKPFTNAERECLKDYATTDRDKALITFLYSTGCRISEALRLNRTDVYNTNQIIVYGKGRKERIVTINDVARYYLDIYLNSRIDNEEALFITNKKGKGCDHPNRLSVGAAEKMLRELGEKAGVKDVHPHRFRRSLCCSLLGKGVPIQDVKEILGHSNISTTTIYNYADPKVLQHELNIYS